MGTGKNTFGSNDKVSAVQYLTFILWALGYKRGTIFQWDKAWKFTDELGITSGDLFGGGVVIISCRALETSQKGKDQTLVAKLMTEGNFMKEQYEKSKETCSAENHSVQEPFTLTAF